MTSLRVDWATTAQARFACEHWHYAGIMPTGKLVKVGAWEDDRFVGVVIFSRGASPFLGKKWALDHTEICELTRVALRDHATPVSRIVSIGLRFLRRTNPGIRLVVSFADPARGHVGAIYQAGNWIYTGESGRTIEIFEAGRWRHVRGAYHRAKHRGISYADAGRRLRAGEPAGRLRMTRGKFRYVYPLDDEIREVALARALPYPKTVDQVQADHALGNGLSAEQEEEHDGEEADARRTLRSRNRASGRRGSPVPEDRGDAEQRGVPDAAGEAVGESGVVPLRDRAGGVREPRRGSLAEARAEGRRLTAARGRGAAGGAPGFHPGGGGSTPTRPLYGGGSS